MKLYPLTEIRLNFQLLQTSLRHLLVCPWFGDCASSYSSFVLPAFAVCHIIVSFSARGDAVKPCTGCPRNCSEAADQTMHWMPEKLQRGCRPVQDVQSQAPL